MLCSMPSTDSISSEVKKLVNRCAGPVTVADPILAVLNFGEITVASVAEGVPVAEASEGQ